MEDHLIKFRRKLNTKPDLKRSIKSQCSSLFDDNIVQRLVHWIHKYYINGLRLWLILFNPHVSYLAKKGNCQLKCRKGMMRFLLNPKDDIFAVVAKIPWNTPVIRSYFHQFFHKINHLYNLATDLWVNHVIC